MNEHPHDLSPDSSEETGGTPAARGFHPLGTAHLVIGIVLLALSVLWALLTGGVIGSGDLRWLLPLPFVLAGAAGLVALALSARRGGAAA